MVGNSSDSAPRGRNRAAGDAACLVIFFFSSRRRHTRSLCDWSSDVCSSDLLKLAPGADADALIHRLADDPRINLQAQTEADYYKDQAVVANQMRVLGMIVAVIMAVGAIFGAMNTMYAAVSARTTEIGTLRALGFAPIAVMTSFRLESLVLAVAAGALGIILAMPINGLSPTFGNF